MTTIQGLADMEQQSAMPLPKEATWRYWSGLMPVDATGMSTHAPLLELATWKPCNGYVPRIAPGISDMSSRSIWRPFGGSPMGYHQWMSLERYASWNAAEKGHWDILEWASANGYQGGTKTLYRRSTAETKGILTWWKG